MIRNKISLAWLSAIALCFGHIYSYAADRGERRVTRTVHNLSTRVTNPRGARSEVCRYCHTPHNARGMKSLWSRQESTAVYKIYESSTLDARPGQPNGTSKMCLSCHDGTLALAGSGSKGIGAGLMNLGTDLSDDHPVSFVYDSALAAKDQQLRAPSLLPKELKLDRGSQLQCSTCHDVHNNQFGNFLAVDDENGVMCTSCHNMTGWNGSAHNSSPAQVKQLSTSLPYPTVSQNSCRICHRPHNALGHERLQLYEAEEQACLSCHNGTVAKTDISSQLRKISAHNPMGYTNIHDPVEPSLVDEPHVECADCHNPHSVTQQTGNSSIQTIGNTMQNVRGVTLSGAEISKATHEYQVCLRCHSDKPIMINRRITRAIPSTNIREEISPTASSFHPIARGLIGSNTVSLKDTITRGSTINCTDCHNNDQGTKAGGSGPNGPHGSRFDFLLERNYLTMDTVAESEQAYDLCYKCHKRESILGDESFPYHKKHIVNKQASCSACHDPHGVIAKDGTSQAHLINFNTAVVTPSSSGVIEFKSDPITPRKGSCALSCHGKNHEHAKESY